MKTTILRPVEVEISTVALDLPVRYGEEEIPNDFPGRDGEKLKMLIDIDTGKIRDWPAGREADVFLTVKDGGTYRLLGPASEEIGAIRQNYVPHGLIPGEYGDVVLFTIDGEGLISNWPAEPDVSEFFNDEDED